MHTRRLFPAVATLTLFAFGLLTAATVWLVTVPATTDGPERSSAPMAGGSATTPTPTTAHDDRADDARRAEATLAELRAEYRHLDGVRVTFGTTPKGEEAVAYYTDGEIQISDAHTVDVEKILAHEVWHVIDWRDNGRLDWGEDLPPSNSLEYYR